MTCMTGIMSMAVSFFDFLLAVSVAIDTFINQIFAVPITVTMIMIVPLSLPVPVPVPIPVLLPIPLSVLVPIPVSLTKQLT